MPDRRYFNKETHSCSRCDMLMTKEAFKYHTLKECFIIEFKGKELEKEIERSNYGLSNVSSRNEVDKGWGI